MLDISPKYNLISAENEIITPPNFQDTPLQTVGGFSVTPSEITQAKFTQVNLGATTIVIDNTQSIQIAINILNGVGGGTLYLKAGTYVVETPLVGIAPLNIIGASSSNTIINFNSTSANLSFTVATVYTTGTVTEITLIGGLPIGVTGLDTLWVANATAGQQIFLGTRWYRISSVTDDTHLVLSEGYTDDLSLPTTYRICTPLEDIEISELTFTGSTGTAIVLTDCRDVDLNDVITQSSNKGIVATNCFIASTKKVFSYTNASSGFEFTNVGFGHFEDMLSIGNTGAGFVFNNIKTLPVYASASNSNGGNGISFTNCKNMFVEFDLNSNGGHGAELISGNDTLVFRQCSMKGNGGDGIKLTATSDNIGILACRISDNTTYGINIAAATNDNVIVSSNILSGNTTANGIDSGTGTVIRGNVGWQDNFTYSVGLQYFMAGETIVAGNAVSISNGTIQTDVLGAAAATDQTFANINNYFAQKFTTPAALEVLNSIKTTHRNNGGTGSATWNFQIDVYADSGGSPTGDSLGNATGSYYTDGGEFNTDITFTFATPIALSVSTAYHYVIKVTSVSGSATANGYAYNYIKREDSAGQGTNSSTDAGVNWGAINGALKTTIVYRTSVVSKLYKSNSTSDNFRANGFVGFAQVGGTVGNSISVKTFGTDTTQTGLTVGSTYYLSDTSGAIGSSAGTQSRKIGISISTTGVLIKNDNA